MYTIWFLLVTLSSSYVSSERCEATPFGGHVLQVGALYSAATSRSPKKWDASAPEGGLGLSEVVEFMPIREIDPSMQAPFYKPISNPHKGGRPPTTSVSVASTEDGSIKCTKESRVHEFVWPQLRTIIVSAPTK